MGWGLKAEENGFQTLSPKPSAQVLQNPPTGEQKR